MFASFEDWHEHLEAFHEMTFCENCFVRLKIKNLERHKNKVCKTAKGELFEKKQAKDDRH